MEISRETFRRDFAAAAAVCPSRSPSEVLRYVGLGTDGERAALAATNGEVYLTIGDGDLRQLLPADRVQRILSVIDDDTITITTEAIGTASDQFKLQTPPVSEFPELRDCEVSRWYAVDAAALRQALLTVVPACSSEAVRLALGGVCLEFSSADSLAVVATDSRRLIAGEVACNCPGEPDEEVRPVIPADAVKTLCKVLTRGESCRVGFGLSGGVVFEIGDARLIVSPLAGRFPAWRKVVAAATRQASFSLPAHELLSAVQSAAIVTTEESRGVDVAISRDGIKAAASGADVGAANVSRQLQLLGECQFRCDFQYLIEGLRPVADCEIDLTHNGPEGAVHFAHDGGWQFLLMPMITDLAQ